MSESVNRYAEDVSELRRRVRVVHPCCHLSDSDVALVIDTLVMRIALLGDLLSSDHGSSVFRRSVFGITTLDTQAYFTDWKYLSAFFRKAVDTDDPCLRDWSSFKQKTKGGVHYKWTLASCEPFFRELTGIEFYASLNQWLVLDSHLNLKSVDLKPEMIKEYRRDEELMSSWEYPDLQPYANIVSEWFSDYVPCLQAFQPKHGPGSVREISGRPSQVMKCFHFIIDEQLRELFNEVLYLMMDEEEILFHPLEAASDSWRTCTLVCVPKSPLTNRTISKEPTTLQWCQQGIRSGIDEYFRSHLSSKIDLHDQEASRSLALLGSKVGEYDTLDLSKASDSVTLALVQELFAKTALLDPLLMTRSLYCDLDDGDGDESVIRLAKFAPMGSALCFPIECVVFACVCEQAIREITGRKSRNDDYRIYGDDIVIRHEFTQKCCSLLSELHFTVNVNKSFTGTGSWRFREACGVEALNGADITPLRLPRSLLAPSRMGTMKSVEPVLGFYELINEAHKYGYRRLRQCLNQWALCRREFHTIFRMGESDKNLYGCRVFPTFVVDDCTDTNYLVKHRRNDALCRNECFCTTLAVTPNDSSHPMDQEAAYWLWFWSRPDREEAVDSYRTALDNYVESMRYSPFGTGRIRWVRRWVPSLA